MTGVGAIGKLPGDGAPSSLHLLHSDEDALWRGYQYVNADAALLDRDALKRRMSRRRFPIFFPPPLLDHNTATQFEADTLNLVNLIRSIPERIFHGDIARWLRFLGIKGAEAEGLLRFATPSFIRRAAHFARPDFIITDQGPKIVEINVSPSLGGINTANPYAEAFRKSGFYGYLTANGIEIEMPDLNRLWGAAFREVACVSAAKTAPVMFEARVDPNERPTGHQFFANRANQMGYAAIDGMLQDLVVDERGVSVDGIPVDAIVTMFTWSECRRFVAQGMLEELANADAKGLVDFVTPPVFALFDSKANLELLSDERFATHYDAVERQLINRYIPRTFRLDESTKSRAIHQQCELVSKPADECGGRGILIGKQVSRETWVANIEAACRGEFLAVCQELLPPLHRRLVTDGDHGTEFFISLAPIVLGNVQGGILARQCKASGDIPILNVKSGAEAAMAFAIS